jgi:hypothetical protein
MQASYLSTGYSLKSEWDKNIDKVEMSLIDIIKGEDFRKILILAGLLFILLGLAETIDFKPIPGSEPYLRGIGGILLTAGIILSLKIRKPLVWILPFIFGVALFFLPVGPSDIIKFPDVTIEITNPQEGAEVSSPLTVEGTVDRELPEDWYLWMFYFNYEDWYPQYRIVPFEREWKSTAWLGSETDVEKDVAVVLGNKDADSKFQQGEPLDILPQGAKVYDQITVIVREI